MKKIKNTYIKKLAFIFEGEGSFVINKDEEKKVSDEMADKLLKNPWIKEIKTDVKVERKPEKKDENIKKVD
jgi:phosphoribosylformylglycinamidine (FGAM) synthase PurS component